MPFQRRYATNPGLHYCVESEKLDELTAALCECLTDWEKVIVWLLTNGWNQSSAARQLGVSHQAIEYHINQVRYKIGQRIPRLSREAHGRTRKNGRRRSEVVDPDRICPECGGPKTRVSLRCRWCASKHTQATRVCPMCGGVKDGKSYVCVACYQDQRAECWPEVRREIMATPIDGMKQGEIVAVVTSRGPWSQDTVRRALLKLEADGVIYTVRGAGKAKHHYYV